MKNKNNVTTKAIGGSPPNASVCHGKQRFPAPIYWVQKDGSEIAIGKVWHCPYDEFQEGKRTWCYQISGLSKFKNWPAGLGHDTLRNLLNSHPPGHWLSPGYHIQQHGLSWRNMRGNKYLPLEKDRSQLIELAQRILAFRDRHGEADVKNLVKDTAKDFKVAAAGEKKEPESEIDPDDFHNQPFGDEEEEHSI